MGKLKKVLLLVLALCVMISIMSIAAAATGAETQKTIYVNATIKDGYTGVMLRKYQDYVNDISLTPVPGKENTYSAVVTAGERYNFYYTKSGGSESPGTFTVPTDNRDLLLVRPNPNGITTDYLWHVYGQEYTDIGTVVGGKNKYVSSFPDLIYNGESVGSGNTNILRAILSDKPDVAVGSNIGDNYGSSVSFNSNVDSTTMYCVVKDGNTFVNAKFTAYVGYKVTFDRNGKGSWANEPAPQYIIPGSKATSPSMTANGFTLAGWFKETGCTNEWDFDNDTVTEDITLYAKWVPNVAQIGSTTYTSLADAIAAAQSGETIELLCDIEISSMVNLDKIGTYTINGAGHTISMALGTTFDGSGAIVFGPAGTNPIADVNQIPNKTYTLQNVTITGFDAEILRIEGCGLTLDNVTFDHNNIAKSLGRGYHLVRVANANVTIQNSTFAGNTVTVESKEGDVIYVDETSLFTLSNCLFNDNAVAGHSIVRIAGGSGHSVTNNTFIRNEVSSSSNGAVLYVSKPATVTYNLFKENSVTEFNNGKEAVIVLGSGATGSVVNYNAFYGNTLAVAHTAAAKSGTIHTGADCDLSYNYWGGNAESDIKGSSNLATNENYAVSYAPRDNANGCTVTLYVPSVAQIGEKTYASLADAIADVPDNTATTITMIADSVEAGTITIASTKNIVLDLNGYTVSYSENASEKSVYFITNKGTLTVRDTSEGAGGSITYASGNSNYSYESVTVYNLGGTLNLVSGSIVNNLGGLAYAVNNSSNAWGVNDDKETVFNMTGGVLSAPNGDAALRVYQNCAQNSDPYSHNTVNITGGTILDTGIFVDSYIYQPNANTTGEGILIDINISGGEIHGLIDLKLRHAYNTTLTITGGDFRDARLWVRKHGEWNAVTPEPTSPIVTISGGTWSFVTGMAFGLSYDCGATSWTSYEQPYCVTGGVFNVDLNNYSGIKFESGKTGVANSGANKATYPYTVGVAVAKIGTKGYETLQAAIDAAQTGDTVTLYRDVTGSFTIGKSITLTSVNGAKITGSGTSAISINASGVAVTLNGITIAKGATRGVCIDSNAANVTLVINNSSIAAGSYALDTRPGADYATVTVSGTTLDGWAAMNIWGNHGAFNISGSTLNGANTTTQSSSNDFAVIALEADTAARTSGELMGAYADGNTITLTGCTIGATTSSANSQAIIVYNAYGEDTNPSQTKAAEYLGSGKHAKNNTVIFDGCDYVSTTTGGLVYDGASKLAGGDGTTIYAANNNSFIVKTSGTYTIDPTTYLASGFEAVNNGNGTWTVDKIKVAQIGTTKYTSLEAAIDAAQDGDTITLLRDIDLTATVNIEKSLTIDLNNKNITATNARALWVKSGEVAITGTGMISATKTENGSFSSSSSVIRVGNSGTAKAKLTIGAGVTVSTDYCYGVTVFGTNEGGVELVVNGTVTVTGTAAAISGNGNSGNKGNVTINAGAVVTATADAAIYHPQGDALTINGGSITGPVAVYQKSGTMTINGGTFTANAQAAVYTPKGDGLAPTGDTIVIDNCGYPGGAPSASISGATITITNGKQIGYYVNGTSAEGTVRADSAYTLNTNTEKKWVADTSVTGYSYRIATPTYVAQIGETKYVSLADAIDAANADTTSDSITITLLKDIDFSTEEYAGYKWAGSTYNPLTIKRSNVTIDLDGHTISEMGNTALVFGKLLAKDGRIANITIKNGTLRAGKTADVTNSYVLGIAGVDGVLVKNITTMGGINVYTGSKNVVIDSCNVTGTKYYTVCAQCGSDVTIKGTTYTKNTDNTVANKSMFWIQGAGTDSDMATTENPTGEFGTSSITIESGNFTVDTSNGGVFYLISGVKPIVKGGYFNIDPTAYVADGYAVVTSDLAGYTHKVVPYVEQSTTTAEATTTTTDEQSGTTTTTTTTTNLATAENGQDTQYVIKVETTTVTTSTSNPENPTEDTNTVYKPVNVDVTSGNDVATNVVVTNTSGATDVTAAKATVEAAVTGQAATFEAKLDGNSGTSSANVLKTTAAANAIAKAAATVGAAGKTGDITDAKVILQTTLKSYTLADDTNSSVKATKVVYDIKPVAVIYSDSTQLGNAVELDNADIKEGETFTFTIPVPANMTGTKVKVSHIGTNGYSTEIGTYTVEGTGNERYVTVTVDHFSEFELEETTVAIDGNCKITAAIALDDSININFYVQSLASGTSKENYKVVYSFNGETETTAYGASWVETVNGSGKYFFKVAECAASQMNDKVSFKVYYNDGYNDVEIKSISYSIRDYCVNMIKKNSDQKLVELCRAVLDYGAAAQNYFNYNTANLANAGGYGLASPVTEIGSEFNALAVDRKSDVSKLTVSLNTVSKTEINFYITASDVTNVTVKLGETPVEGVVTEQLSDGRYKVTIKGIAAANLNNVYTLTFKTAVGTSTLRYSALTYSYGKQSSQTAGKLSLAIYNYYLNAKAYFG